MLIRGKILSTAECQDLVSEFDASQSKQIEEEAFYRHSIGLYEPPSARQLVARLEAELTKTFGPLAYENSYLRAYVRGSMLKIHTDRPGLDVTLSVCLEHDFEGEYPLWCSRHPFVGPWKDDLPSYELWTRDAVALELGVGDGAAMQGIHFPHWRDVFHQDGRAVYIFFHWRQQRAPISEPPRPIP